MKHDHHLVEKAEHCLNISFKLSNMFWLT